MDTEEMHSKFGAEDTKGAINYLTTEQTLQAFSLVKTGEMMSLAVNLDRTTPAYGWRRFELIVAQNEGTFHSNNEDIVFAPINTGTQIDGLAHMGVDGHFYNGHKGSDIQKVDGLTQLGIEQVPPIMTRAVLLDIAGLKGVERLKIGTEITIADLEAALQKQGIDEIRQGDIVIFHTGHRRLLETEEVELFLSGEPGPGKALAEYLATKGIVAVGADTGSVEVMPFKDQNDLFPVHQTLLAKHGVYLLENLATQQLVDKQWWEFLIVIAPLPIVGASSSWINPIAIK